MKRLWLLGVLAFGGVGCSSSKDFWSTETPANLHDNWAQSRPGSETPTKETPKPKD